MILVTGPVSENLSPFLKDMTLKDKYAGNVCHDVVTRFQKMTESYSRKTMDTKLYLLES